MKLTNEEQQYFNYIYHLTINLIFSKEYWSDNDFWLNDFRFNQLISNPDTYEPQGRPECEQKLSQALLSPNPKTRYISTGAAILASLSDSYHLLPNWHNHYVSIGLIDSLKKLMLVQLTSNPEKWHMLCDIIQGSSMTSLSFTSVIAINQHTPALEQLKDEDWQLLATAVSNNQPFDLNLSFNAFNRYKGWDGFCSFIKQAPINVFTVHFNLNHTRFAQLLQAMADSKIKTVRYQESSLDALFYLQANRFLQLCSFIETCNLNILQLQAQIPEPKVKNESRLLAALNNNVTLKQCTLGISSGFCAYLFPDRATREIKAILARNQKLAAAINHTEKLMAGFSLNQAPQVIQQLIDARSSIAQLSSPAAKALLKRLSQCLQQIEAQQQLVRFAHFEADFYTIEQPCIQQPYNASPIKVLMALNHCIDEQQTLIFFAPAYQKAIDAALLTAAGIHDAPDELPIANNVRMHLIRYLFLYELNQSLHKATSFGFFTLAHTSCCRAYELAKFKKQLKNLFFTTLETVNEFTAIAQHKAQYWHELIQQCDARLVPKPQRNLFTMLKLNKHYDDNTITSLDLK